MQISIFMDVEDPINPLADDAALDFARGFTEAGVTGCFCITGEKCRVLMERGRVDVIEALRPHCLGLHTDTHSQHPTTMEMLAGLSYEEGCEAALQTESRGTRAFENAFGRKPAFWGGAGNTWSPEICDVIRRLRFPTYVYALTQVPNQEVHRFNGCLALPQHFAIGEDEWESGRVDDVLRGLTESSRSWSGLFVGHPTRMRYPAFWDIGYAGGRTPASPVHLEPVSDEIYHRRLHGLSDLLITLKDRFEIIGCDQINPEFRPANAEEQRVFCEKTTEAIRAAAKWPIHPPDLDVSAIVEKTMELVET